MLARWGVVSPKAYYHEFWALRDVEFELEKGASLGILGRNGSGKSTLLQVLCGILEPTTGSFATHGRVSALLELGMGFNPEFTGRENVFMNTGILGLTREETEERLDDILAFADIGDFIDQPVKTYSSGMYVRLAFAVAINVDPDVLVVDEALAVGDVLFQNKCYRKFRAIREAGQDRALRHPRDRSGAQALRQRAGARRGPGASTWARRSWASTRTSTSCTAPTGTTRSAGCSAAQRAADTVDAAT